MFYDILFSVPGSNVTEECGPSQQDHVGHRTVRRLVRFFYALSVDLTGIRTILVMFYDQFVTEVSPNKIT